MSVKRNVTVPADSADMDGSEGDLLDARRLMQKPTPGAFGYPNMGFMALGLLLRRVTGVAHPDLLKQRIFDPMGMTAAVCGVPKAGPAMPGYRGGLRTPWWSDLSGAGGVASSIRDLSTYCASYLSPPPSMIRAIEFAIAEHASGRPPMGLGWFRQLNAQYHEGSSGGFQSYIGVVLVAVCG